VTRKILSSLKIEHVEAAVKGKPRDDDLSRSNGVQPLLALVVLVRLLVEKSIPVHRNPGPGRAGFREPSKARSFMFNVGRLRSTERLPMNRWASARTLRSSGGGRRKPPWSTPRPPSRTGRRSSPIMVHHLRRGDVNELNHGRLGPAGWFQQQ